MMNSPGGALSSDVILAPFAIPCGGWGRATFARAINANYENYVTAEFPNRFAHRFEISPVCWGA